MGEMRLVCLYVCVSVCPLTMSQKHVQISPTFRYMVPVAMARSSGDIAIRMLPVLWMAPCFHNYNGANGPQSSTMLCSVEFARWRHWTKLLSTIAGMVVCKCCEIHPQYLLYGIVLRHCFTMNSFFSVWVTVAR